MGKLENALLFLAILLPIEGSMRHKRTPNSVAPSTVNVGDSGFEFFEADSEEDDVDLFFSDETATRSRFGLDQRDDTDEDATTMFKDGEFSGLPAAMGELEDGMDEEEKVSKTYMEEGNRRKHSLGQGQRTNSIVDRKKQLKFWSKGTLAATSVAAGAAEHYIRPSFRMLRAVATSSLRMNTAIVSIAFTGLCGALREERRKARLAVDQETKGQAKYMEELEQKVLALDTERGRIEAALEYRVSAIRKKVVKAAQSHIDKIETKVKELRVAVEAAEKRAREFQAVAERVEAQATTENGEGVAALVQAQTIAEENAVRLTESEARASALKAELTEAVAARDDAIAQAEEMESKRKNALDVAVAQAVAGALETAEKERISMSEAMASYKSEAEQQRERMKELVEEHQSAVEKLRHEHNSELKRLQTVMKHALQRRRIEAANLAGANHLKKP